MSLFYVLVLENYVLPTFWDKGLKHFCVPSLQHGCSVWISRYFLPSTSSSFSFSLSITLSLSPHAHPHTNTDPVMHNSRLCNIYAVFQSSSELSTNGAGPESSVWTQRECWRLIRWDRPKLGGQCSRRHWNHKTSIPPKISWCARALVSEAYKNRQPKKGKRENRTVHGTVRGVTCPET